MTDSRAEVRAHIEKHLGPAREVFRDDGSSIDILHLPPHDTRPVRTLITCGMSDQPMNGSSDKNGPRHIELMVTLPRSWPFDAAAQGDARWNWPLQQLRAISALPTQANRWLGWGETIANGDPPKSLGPNTKQCAAVIVPSLLVPRDFYELTISAHSIAFFAVLPLYKEELELKDSKGVNHLFETLLDAGVKDFIDTKRRNVAKKRFGIF